MAAKKKSARLTDRQADVIERRLRAALNRGDMKTASALGKRLIRSAGASRARKNPYTAKSSGKTYYPERCTVKAATKLMNKRKSQYLKGSRKRTARIGTCGVRDAEFTLMVSNKRGSKRRSKKPISEKARLAALKRKRTLAKARKLIGTKYSRKLPSEGKGRTAKKARERRALAAGRKPKQLRAGRARSNPTHVFPNPTRKASSLLSMPLLDKAFKF